MRKKQGAAAVTSRHLSKERVPRRSRGSLDRHFAPEGERFHVGGPGGETKVVRRGKFFDETGISIT
jgi:hypothetical protein